MDGPSLKKNINFCSKFPSLFDISLIDPYFLIIVAYAHIQAGVITSASSRPTAIGETHNI